MKANLFVSREQFGPLVTAAALVATCLAVQAAKKPDPGERPMGPAVLWRDPIGIESRNLFYGPGGRSHEPQGTFRFVKEDMSASSPKFDVAGSDGTAWKAKLGIEVHPEVAASRLLWAVGYFANENYFVPEIRIENMPHLHRGSKYVEHDGTVRGVRLKRHLAEEKKIGNWSWKQSPFTGTREWYGLRVLMAVINNWDLKDVNNSIYQVNGSHPEQRYVVSDLGASFGTTGLNRGAKGNVEEYRRSKWINDVSDGFVDFNVPSDPGFGYVFDVPEMARRKGLLWIGRHIPVEHARWMGSLLARLSPQQVRDAFRAGGYSATEVEEFSQLLGHRIQELNSLGDQSGRHADSRVQTPRGQATVARVQLMTGLAGVENDDRAGLSKSLIGLQRRHGITGY